MSFQITTQPFFGSDATVALPDGRDPLIEYVLINTHTGELASIIPDFGGILRVLVLQPKAAQPAPDDTDAGLFSVIEAPETPQALIAGETYASAILYPFPSRVQHGVYSFEGTDYALHMNETRRNNAIHGLVYEKPFNILDQGANDEQASLTLRYSHTGDFEGYPFPFELTITYTLSADGLTLSYTALNNGDTPSPAAFGWHPYFTFRPFPLKLEPGVVESDSILDEMTLTLPAASKIGLGDDMMPNGEKTPQENTPFPLKDWHVDNPFRIDPQEADSAETRLQVSKKGTTLVISQETGPGKLNYLVVFTPPKRDRIAIEPLTANVNAFNTGEGLAELEPGDSLDGWIRVSLRR